MSIHDLPAVNATLNATSGVLLVAKKRAALVALHAMLRGRGMDKRYLVAVAGRFRNQRKRVRVALAKRVTGEGERRVSVSEAGQEAETIFQLVRRGDAFSLLEAELLTGRTHQIRVHLAKIGHPVFGDRLYGAASNVARRQMLHAYSIRFLHPKTRKRMALTAPIPRDFLAALKSVKS